MPAQLREILRKQRWSSHGNLHVIVQYQRSAASCAISFTHPVADHVRCVETVRISLLARKSLLQYKDNCNYLSTQVTKACVKKYKNVCNEEVASFASFLQKKQNKSTKHKTILYVDLRLDMICKVRCRSRFRLNVGSSEQKPDHRQKNSRLNHVADHRTAVESRA
jgi:hypothetical protein